MSSLPVSGIDGTTRRPGREWGAALGRAHLKTGSLRDTMGLAGYVLGVSGRRYAFVAIVNHPNASAARPVLDALVQWTAEDAVR
jgi:D-alanyl-D-alanine carboxypeptidase/D-alanyl-D-alanine-endopeptidase (penicillin-binding protein 4)